MNERVSTITKYDVSGERLASQLHIDDQAEAGALAIMVKTLKEDSVLMEYLKEQNLTVADPERVNGLGKNGPDYGRDLLYSAKTVEDMFLSVMMNIDVNSFEEAKILKESENSLEVHTLKNHLHDWGRRMLSVALSNLDRSESFEAKEKVKELVIKEKEYFNLDIS